MTTEAGYQGWTNYETWAVALWLDNEQPSYEYWHEAGREAWAEAGDETDQWTRQAFSRSELARLNLADKLKDELDTNAELPELPTFYADLLNAALSDVSWRELAEHYLNAVEGFDAEDSTAMEAR